MATIFIPLTSLSSYHLIAWGSLLGMELYQSFVMTKVCYLYLPRPQFSSLQKRVFPVYFGLQTALVAATAITYPPGSLLALVENKADAVALGVTLGTSVLNMLAFGPRTSQAMVERAHQETRDGRKHDEVRGSSSKEMQMLKRHFSRNHAMTIHLNLIAIIGTVLYGLSLSSRIVR